MWLGALEVATDRVHPLPKPGVVPHDARRPRELAMKLLGQGAVVLTDPDRADASLGGRHEQPSDGAVHDREADAVAACAAAIGRRAHAEMGGCTCVEGGARAPTGVVQRRGHGIGVTEMLAQALDPLALGVLPRTHPDDAPERALEVEGAPADPLAELGEGETRSELVGLDQAARLGDDVQLGPAGIGWSAAKARPEARGQRGVDALEEPRSIAPGPSRRTGRAAEDARAHDRHPEAPLGPRVVFQHGLPARVVREEGALLGVALAIEASRGEPRRALRARL